MSELSRVQHPAAFPPARPAADAGIHRRGLGRVGAEAVHAAGDGGAGCRRQESHGGSGGGGFTAVILLSGTQAQAAIFKILEPVDRVTQETQRFPWTWLEPY